jgi:hypothetical protein
MPDQRSKAVSFAESHHTGTFVVPNPWDAGTARVLSGYGYGYVEAVDAKTFPLTLAARDDDFFPGAALGYAESDALLGTS